MEYILAVDQSTSGTKGVVFTAHGRMVARADVPHKQITNECGWVEHDPEEIYVNTLRACRMAVDKAGIDPSQVRALGISNQRETTVCWDRLTGRPAYNAIVWQCGRAAEIAERLSPYGEKIRSITGLNLSPFFSAAKFAWVLENVSEAAALAESGRLCLGNVDAWLVYKMTGGAFKTDYSNASRTQLLNLDALSWDDGICGLFGIRSSMLPEICPSDSCFGYTTLEGLFKEAVPIHAVMGDSHAALYANGCLRPFTAKATLGTGTSVMVNLGASRPKVKTAGVVESLAWGIGGSVDYVLEGNINYSGAIIKWLSDDLGLIESSAESGELARSVSNTGGVYLVPAFTGLGAPYWRNDVRALICGMNTGTKRAHIVRAGLEAIAYQIRDVVEELKCCCGGPLGSICFDGGAIRNEFLMEFIAGMLSVQVMASELEELSAAGVAFLASTRLGCSDLERVLAGLNHREIRPSMDDELRESLYAGWKSAMEMLIK